MHFDLETLILFKLFNLSILLGRNSSTHSVKEFVTFLTSCHQVASPYSDMLLGHPTFNQKILNSKNVLNFIKVKDYLEFELLMTLLRLTNKCIDLPQGGIVVDGLLVAGDA